MNTYAEISLEAIKHNITEIRKLLAPPVKFMAVVKANAYGHGAVAVGRAAVDAGANYLAVANLKEAMELADLADKRRLVLMVDHTLLYSSVVGRMKRIVSSGDLGGVYYYDSVRINLGLFQHDVNVIWDLAPHDLSVMDHVLQAKVRRVSALGRACAGTGVEDAAYLTLECEGGLLAHFHLNWLSPVKIRRVMIGGSKKMLLWDDQNPDEKLRIYDKGVRVRTREGLHRVLTSYRIGGMQAPVLDTVEPLAAAVADFLRSIEKKLRPVSDGYAGARIVGLLEAADRSVRKGGAVEIVENLPR